MTSNIDMGNNRLLNYPIQQTKKVKRNHNDVVTVISLYDLIKDFGENAYFFPRYSRTSSKQPW